jgi:hypothetical protein
MKATYKIRYKDAAGGEREIVTEDMNRDAPGWRSQHGWERGAESVTKPVDIPAISVIEPGDWKD